MHAQAMRGLNRSLAKQASLALKAISTRESKIQNRVQPGADTKGEVEQRRPEICAGLVEGLMQTYDALVAGTALLRPSYWVRAHSAVPVLCPCPT